MRFLLTPVGSGGDVHPYVGLGRELRARGHEAVILTAEPHRSVVERSGLGFAPTFTAEDYQAATLNPELWHPRRGFVTVMRLVLAGLDAAWTQLEGLYQPGNSFIVGHPLAFAARSFEEKVGAPAATLHLAPSSLRTVYRIPALPPGVDISGWPLALKRALWFAIDRTQLDPAIAPVFNPWRARHGLPPLRRVFQGWFNSPGRVIGLFPEWFGPRQPDWPSSFEFASFPLWDDPGGHHMDAGLAAFLGAGSPPVIATPGTANRYARGFFAALTVALARLGRRGVFLTGFPEQLPPELPDTIIARPYAPLSEVLPQAAALVHHGGIGTLAQGLASGVPQLVMPMAFDQPDNAMLAARLGTARWLPPARFTADRVTAALERLLQDAEVSRAAAECRARLAGLSGISLACDRLERDAGV